MHPTYQPRSEIITFPMLNLEVSEKKGAQYFEIHLVVTQIWSTRACVCDLFYLCAWHSASNFHEIGGTCTFGADLDGGSNSGDMVGTSQNPFYSCYVDVTKSVNSVNVCYVSPTAFSFLCASSVGFQTKPALTTDSKGAVHRHGNRLDPRQDIPVWRCGDFLSSSFINRALFNSGIMNSVPVFRALQSWGKQLQI